MKFRVLQLLIALDQFLGTVVGLFIGGAWADETLSSRAHREWPTVEAMLDTIFGQGHCRESFESERIGRQLPPEARP